MRSLIGLLLWVWLAGIAQAADYDLTIRQNTSGQTVVVIGDLRGQAVPVALITALAYFVSWREASAPAVPMTWHGAPTTLDQVPLGLPVTAFSMEMDGMLAQVQAQVRILRGGQEHRLTARLTLEPIDSRWRVREIAIE